MPYDRYRPAHERVDVPLGGVRTWPHHRIEQAPLWVPVDLRDGNQALAEPMDPARKQRMFDMFVAMGFKEIEVGYPSASRTDFAFVRRLAEEGRVPDDVTVVVFTPARRDLIDRTFEAIEGLPRTVVHMYTATAPTWRNVVLGHDRDELTRLILAGGEDVLRGAERHRGGEVRFEFSPEVFNMTEPDYALEVCDAMTRLWDARPDRPVIVNLPATVEIATPNVYADQIEYMHRNLARRDGVVLSVHPHNDRGTGVACAELALLAGAQRVEGCLFGNGERTGNVCLVTLALNLYTQGVDPMLDFSDIDEIRRTVEYCNRLPVHERQPYAGDLVHTAFSGTHQDAIKKGLARHDAQPSPDRAPWDVPYLPIDPHDLGRSYEAVIRVNSQSGKGGVAYLLQTGHGLDLPRRMQIEFSRAVQTVSDEDGQEVSAKRLWELFEREYLNQDAPVRLVSHSSVEPGDGAHHLTIVLDVDGTRVTATGTGTGPIAAFVDALAQAGIGVEVLDFSEHALSEGHDSVAAAYAECRVNGRVRWGAALGASTLNASLRAVLSAVNRPWSGEGDEVGVVGAPEVLDRVGEEEDAVGA
ncbi:2-isopropylmalate synthase [Actinomadura logoneensis]|nr:2-isopropylmalate synthase [Actinomadura logoneensis]